MISLFLFALHLDLFFSPFLSFFVGVEGNIFIPSESKLDLYYLGPIGNPDPIEFINLNLETSLQDFSDVVVRLGRQFQIVA